jgi:hypothetical protein
VAEANGGSPSAMLRREPEQACDQHDDKRNEEHKLTYSD